GGPAPDERRIAGEESRIAQIKRRNGEGSPELILLVEMHIQNALCDPGSDFLDGQWKENRGRVDTQLVRAGLTDVVKSAGTFVVHQLQHAAGDTVPAPRKGRRVIAGQGRQF